MVFMGATRNGHYINSLSSSAVALTPSLVFLEHPVAIQLSLSQSVTVEHTSSADAASLTPTQRTMVFKIFKLLKKCNYFNFTLQFR